MYVYISIVVILSWSLPHVAPEIKCSRREQPWIEGMKECIYARGSPLDFWGQSTGLAIHKQSDLRSGVSVWTSDFFSTEYVSNCKDCCQRQRSELCEMVYIQNRISNTEVFYSECTAQRMYVCRDTNGWQIRIRTGTFYESESCGNFFPFQLALVNFIPGFYWKASKLQGFACFLKGDSDPGFITSAFCGSYNRQTGQFYRQCKTNQTSLCDIGIKDGVYTSFSRSCFEDQTTIHPETTTKGITVTKIVSPFTPTSSHLKTSIDTQPFRNNSFSSPVMLKTSLNKGFEFPNTTKVMITSPTQNFGEPSQGKNDESKAPNVGLIVGIVIGITVALSVAGIVAFILARRGICLRKRPGIKNMRKRTKNVQAHDNITYDNTSDRPYSVAVDTEPTITYSKSTPGSVHIKDGQQTVSQDDYDTTLQVRKLVDKQNYTYDTTTLKTQASDNLYDTTFKTKEFHANNEDYNTIFFYVGALSDKG